MHREDDDTHHTEDSSWSGTDRGKGGATRSHSAGESTGDEEQDNILARVYRYILTQIDDPQIVRDE